MGWPAGHRSLEELARHAEHRHLGADRRYRAGIGLEGIIRIRDFLRGGGLVIASEDGGQFLLNQALRAV